MKNTFGSSVCVTLFGESHGEAIGAVLDGLMPGIKIDREYIEGKLNQRRPSGAISTKRVEADEFKIISGEFGGYTTGAPLCILIPNLNTRSGDYADLRDMPRPSHADYVAGIKYGGYQDYRGGGHFSGRVTAALVAAGAILASALEKKGIYIGSHISLLHGVKDRAFGDYMKDIELLNGKQFPVMCDEAEEKMRSEITRAAAIGDSVGGVLETAVVGLDAGVGEPWFDSIESVISHAVFSVPGVKGIEFGSGFKLADMYGSEANDPFIMDDGRVKTATNNSGGINGGISNGMPIIFRTAIRPTPSIYKPQGTVKLSEMIPCELQINGRHDPAIIHRARAVIDAVTAIALSDLLAVRFGTDWLRG